MIRIFKTTDSGIRKVAVAEEGCWIALTNPTAEELSTTADQFNIDVDDLKSPLDEEERSRIQVEENYTLIILDIPTIEERKGREYFYTIPFGIIFTDKYIFTVCLVDSPVLTVFMDGRVRDFYTYKRTRFIYQMLYRNATMFLQYLKIIDKKSDEVEKKLHISQRNQELIEMLDLEKSLVYFTTSLRGNEVVLEKLMRNTSIPRYEDDEELLEDVIIENKQAIEMAKIYSSPPENKVILQVHSRLIIGICKLHSKDTPINTMPNNNKSLTTPFLFSFPSFIIFPAKVPSITVTPKVKLLHIQV